MTQNRMIRLIYAALVAIALPFLLHAQTVPPAQAKQDSGPVVNADNALTQALVRGDKSAVDKLLDKHFEFTNPDGKTFTQAQMMAQFPPAITAAPGSTSVRAYNYGQVGDVYGVNANTYFLRIWVKRSDGWKLFNYLETPIGHRVPLAPGGGYCENPCHTLPFTPTTQIDKDILKAWQMAKNAEWHPNAQNWAPVAGDEFSIINSGTDRSKAERVAMLAKQQAAGESGPPGDPIKSMRMFDIDDKASIMLSIHAPYRGGKPYYNVRLWVLRDGRPQLVASQQTTIQSAAPLPPVGQ